MRERWSWRGAFVVAAIGSAVGLGNIWRFPYVVYESGGGAFLIPFFIALITAGIPLMMLEYTIGQRFAGAAPLAMKQAKRGFEFVGWWAVLCGFAIITYYAVILGWSLRYLVAAFSLEWGANTTDFFFNQILQIGDIGVLGGLPWGTLVPFLIGWLIVFGIVRSGVKGLGKVVMVTVPLPFILICILMIRGITLPGSAEGLNWYLQPDFGALTDPSVWMAAYGQVFYSLSLAMGILIAYASYLPKDSDISNNAFMISFGDALVAFIAGIAVFSTTGYMAGQLGVPVGEVIADGVGLAFVAYPEAIGLMPVAPAVIGVLFFLTVFTLGVDSAFSLTEGITSAVMDKFKIARTPAALLISTLALLVGLVFVSRGGLFWLDLVDYYVMSFGLTIVGLFTCILVGWVYGADKIREHINSVSEIKVGKWFDVCIKLITPAMLIVLLVLNISDNLATPYEGYPQWMQVAGGLGVIGVVILGGIILSVIRGRKTVDTTVGGDG